MRKVWSFVRRMVREDQGQSLVEYGLIIALIAVVVMGVLFVLGGHIHDLFGNVANQLTTPSNQG